MFMSNVEICSDMDSNSYMHSLLKNQFHSKTMIATVLKEINKVVITY